MLNFELNVPYTYTPPEKPITANLMVEVHEHLIRLGYRDEAQYLRKHLAWQYLAEYGLDVYMKDGRAWHKRLASLLYKSRKIKMTPTAISVLGTTIKKAVSQDPLVFEFKKEAKWRAGAFAERDGSSCWFEGGAYNYCLVGLFEREEGFAVLYYDSEEDWKQNSGVRGKGRHWLWKESDSAGYIFNAYGVGLDNAASILASTFGMQFTKISLQSVGAYINQGNKQNLLPNGQVAGGSSSGLGYAITDHPLANRTVSIADFRHMETCARCGNRHVEADLTRLDGILYCGDCYSAVVAKCYVCANRFDKSRGGVKARNDYGAEKDVCPACAKRRLFHCHVHGASVSARKYTVWHTNRHYCMECRNDDRIRECLICGRYADVFIEAKHNTSYCICKTCARKLKNEEITYVDTNNIT